MAEEDGIVAGETPATPTKAAQPTGASRAGTEDGAPAPDNTPGLPSLRSCTAGKRPTGLPVEDWRHRAAKIITLGDPGHSVQDLVVPPTGPLVIGGKFAYGATSKDLEDESIQIWIDDCAKGYRLLGQAVTDSDGRVAHTVSTNDIPGIGVYGLHLRVEGDDSWVSATLRILPVATELIVFDIDGTLTTGDDEVVQDVLADLFARLGSGDSVPEPRPSAVEITRLRADQGYQLIYLTGRPYLLTNITRGWLADLGFAPGTLHVTDSNSQAIPGTGGVGTFKAEYIGGLRDAGFTLNAGYGNASTDLYAYGRTGVPAARTFIVGPHGGEAGSVALGDDYDAHLPVARSEAPPSQPFQQ